MRNPARLSPEALAPIASTPAVLYAAAAAVLVAAIRAETTPQLWAALVAAAVIALMGRYPVYTAPAGEVSLIGVITLPVLVLFGWPAAVIGVAIAVLADLASRPPREAMVQGASRILLLAAAGGAVALARFTGPDAEVAGVALAAAVAAAARTLLSCVRMRLEEGVTWRQAVRFLAEATFAHHGVVLLVSAVTVWAVARNPSVLDRLLVPVVAAAVTLQLYLPRILRGQEERRVLAAVSVLAGAVDAKDAYTADHSAAVASLCRRVARLMNLDELEVHRIYLAALLHDVGKMVVPPEILNKPGALDAGERAVMQTHVEAGFRIVNAIRGLVGIAPIVEASHERLDGKGYPGGVPGDAIPLGARIIAAVDAYNALTTDRPYRPARRPAAAMRELDAHAGTQFDPRVVAALRRVLGLGEPAGAASPAGPVETPPKTAEARRAPAPSWLALLRHPAFALLWGGELVSFIGDAIFLVALPLWVLQLTGSATMLAVTLIAATVGQGLLGFLAGALADRVDRRRVIFVTDSGRAVLVGALPFVLLHSLPGALVLLVVLNVGTVFFRTAVYALIPTVVPREDLLTANALFQITQRIAEVIGGTLGGVIVLALGFHVAFYLDAFSFVVGAACVALMPVARRAGLSAAPPRRITAEIGEGLRYIWQTPVHRALALLILPGYLTLAFDTLQAPMVIKTAGLTAVAYGVINSVVGAGKVASALVLTGTGKRWMTVPFVAAMFAVTGVAVLLFGTTTLYPAFLIAGFLFGVGNISSNIANATISLANAPSAIAGRLMASRQVFIAATTLIGMLIFGRLADTAGPPAALIALGAVSAVGVGVVWLLTGREVRLPSEAGAPGEAGE